MKKNRLLMVLVVFVFSLQLFACQKQDEIQSSDDGTEVSSSTTQSVESDEGKADAVTLTVMGEEITYDKIPEKVVVVGYENVENMVLLGLEDKIVGFTPCMYLPKHVYPELLEKMGDLKALPEVVRGVPGLETVLAEGADMVYALSYHFAEASSEKVATINDLLQNNIYPYATVGSYGDSPDLDVVYQELANLGKIFRVEERAAQEIEKLKGKQQAVEEKLTGLDPKTAFVFDFQDKAGIMTPGGTGFQNNLLKRAGLKNVFDHFESDFDVATNEQILQADPEFIVFIEYYTDGEADEKIEYIESIPELQGLEAIKNKNYIILTGIEYFPSLHNFDAIEKMARAAHKDIFEN